MCIRDRIGFEQLVPRLRPFLKIVHPDSCGGTDAQREQNSESLATLNAVIDASRSHDPGSFTTVELIFHQNERVLQYRGNAPPRGASNREWKAFASTVILEMLAQSGLATPEELQTRAGAFIKPRDPEEVLAQALREEDLSMQAAAARGQAETAKLLRQMEAKGALEWAEDFQGLQTVEDLGWLIRALLPLDEHSWLSVPMTIHPSSDAHPWCDGDRLHVPARPDAELLRDLVDQHGADLVSKQRTVARSRQAVAALILQLHSEFGIAVRVAGAVPEESRLVALRQLKSAHMSGWPSGVKLVVIKDGQLAVDHAAQEVQVPWWMTAHELQQWFEHNSHSIRKMQGDETGSRPDRVTELRKEITKQLRCHTVRLCDTLSTVQHLAALEVLNDAGLVLAQLNDWTGLELRVGAGRLERDFKEGWVEVPFDVTLDQLWGFANEIGEARLDKARKRNKSSWHRSRKRKSFK
eukprot:TRINITY_DN12124_c0_g1_i1.p1 TRINITY_DN12124_c0_g1~~TRINITY_DN12124_c0_g1_i1.p1  ORF type:complete len:467 (+),score=106.73 TRINITY_DN12124_c0_g1_i1:68-1468(+)